MIQMLHHFFKMDGYAVYIWPAYGVAILGMLAITVNSWRSLLARRGEIATLDEDNDSKS